MENYDWPVVGHKNNIKFLQKSIDNNKLSHAYLFSGKEFLGKKQVADNFMSAVLCHDYNQKNKKEADNYPCGKCVFCQQLEKNIHPDVYFLKKDEEKKNITVEQVREMQKLMHMASFLNSYKICLIEKAEDLSESAQNSLLKILEEPKDKTILIVLSNNINWLLPTIVSRCQVIKFQPLSNDEVFDHLVNLGSSREQARIFSALSHGQIGKAIDYYQKQDLFNNYLDDHKKFFLLFSSNLADRFSILDDLSQGLKTNIELADFFQKELDHWQVIFRDLLLTKNNQPHLLTNMQFEDDLKQLAVKYSQKKIINVIKQINLIKKYLTYNINPRLAVENLVLSF